MSTGPAGTTGAAESWDHRRSDARRNHERVLSAAVEVFTEQGLDATIPDVAARAGVGKATVYRSYPTKAHLIEAIAGLHRDWLHGLVATAAEDASTDAAAALSTLVHAITARLATDRLMVEVLTRIEEWESDSVTESATERILALGREQGTLRDDITMTDLQVMIGGVAHALLEMGVSDSAVWRRYADLVLDAFRPRGAGHPRPGPG